jgi:hypothetical protein
MTDCTIDDGSGPVRVESRVIERQRVIVLGADILSPQPESSFSTSGPIKPYILMRTILE